MENFEMTGIAVATGAEGDRKRRICEKVTWDEEQNCEIIYVVHAKGLKNKVAAAKWE